MRKSKYLCIALSQRGPSNVVQCYKAPTTAITAAVIARERLDELGFILKSKISGAAHHKARSVGFYVKGLSSIRPV